MPISATRPPTIVRWLRALRPAPMAVDRRERARVAAGTALGLLVAAMLCHGLSSTLPVAGPWMMAPLGASAMLVIGMPSSPLAQPWAVIGGNTFSALVGVAFARWLGPTELAAALAVGSAVVLMFALRCLHPPGGAVALLMVLLRATDPIFALFPVLANSLLLVLFGMLFNTLTGRPYPNLQESADPGSAQDTGVDAMEADLDAVIARHNQVLDVSRDQLKALLQDTQLHTYQRKLANLRCRDIMSRNLITVTSNTPVHEAWTLFRRHRIKALPVVDLVGGIAGIVTAADFLRHAGGTPADTAQDRFHKLADSARADHPPGVELIQSIMTRTVRVASEDRHLAELIPLFTSTGHHHIPIVDAGQQLVGIITLSDVVATLANVQPRPSAR